MSLWVRIKAAEDYFWNPRTKAVTWKVPAGVEVEWVAQQTDGGGFYYWNKVTRESSWDVPCPLSSRPQEQQQTATRQSGGGGARLPPPGVSATPPPPRFAAAGPGSGQPCGGGEQRQQGPEVVHPHPFASGGGGGDTVQKWPFRVSEQHSNLGLSPVGTVPTPSRRGSTPRGTAGAGAPFLEAEAPEEMHGGDARAAWVMVERATPSPPYYWNFLRRVTQNALPEGERAQWRAHYLTPAGGGEEPGGRRLPPRRVFFENLVTGQKVWQIPGCPESTVRPHREEGAEAAGGCRLEPNLAVMVVGLQQPCHERYNRQVGHVVCFQEGRALVQLSDALGGPILALAPGNLTPLPRPYPVELRGLQQAELNGEVGTVERFVAPPQPREEEDEEEGPGGSSSRKVQRYLVRMRDTSLKSVPATKVLARSRVWNISFASSYRELQTAQEQRVTFIDSKGLHNHVWLRLPSNFWSAQQLQLSPGSSSRRRAAASWPVLVWLPGAGGGTFFTQNKKLLRLAGLQLAAETFVLVSPVCQWKWTNTPEPWVNELVESLRAADWVDPSRIYLTGCSMGGMGTWELGAQRPGLYAALAPVAAHHREDREASIAAELRGKPIFVVHSDLDLTCLKKMEEPLWKALLREGNRRLQVNLSADLDHGNMFRSAYAVDTTLYDWLLQFQLGE